MQDQNAVAVAKALGGKVNVTNIESCFTRVRVEVLDTSRINNAILEDQFVDVIYRENNVIHLVTGQGASLVEERLKKLL